MALNTPRGYGIFAGMETTIALDEKVHQSALRRLAIIEGQVRGLRRMIENGTGCVEVLTQVSAIHEALRGVGKVIVRHHIETCVTEGLQGEERQQHQDELMDLIYKLSK
jgi:DNA-binding FrmR family transcriptional regulator